MHNRDKYPEIWAAMQAAKTELEPLMVARKIHTDAIADVQLEIGKLKQRKSDLNDMAMTDADTIYELNDKIARMARAMGGVVAGSK